MPHFTYTTPDLEQLGQGDVVCRTTALEEILREVHPHYFEKKDYRYFLVLTQSCDLVRRAGGRCTSPYISIAAVRPLGLAIEREVSRLQYDELEEDLGICDSNRKAKLYQFLERVLNNNEDRYFFLYREPLRGLEDDHCAFLQLSIPLKSDLHYQTLLNAKILQLDESFQHKLGYLVGNSYSRVGTDDWTPNHATVDAFKKATRKPIDDLESVTWLEGPVHREVLKRLKILPAGEQTIEKLEEVIREIGKTKDAKRAAILDKISTMLVDLAVEPETAQKLRARLESDAVFRTSIR